MMFLLISTTMINFVIFELSFHFLNKYHIAKVCNYLNVLLIILEFCFHIHSEIVVFFLHISLLCFLFFFYSSSLL